MKDIFKAGIILMVYALVAGAPLAYLNLKTTPIIEANRIRSEESSRAEVLPGMNGGFEEKNDDDFRYWVGYKDEEKTTVGGRVFIAYGKGYSSTIETMVGIDPYGIITGMKVIFQQETPGLGVKIEEDAFIGQFIGKRFGNNRIDSITGATISSIAVANSVEEGLRYFENDIREADVIETDIKDEESEEMLKSMVLPGMDGGFEEKAYRDLNYWVGYKDRERASVGGRVFIANGRGYSSIIRTMVGIDTYGAITGIRIISQKETPGLGDKVADYDFIQQFVGQKIGDIEVNSISGATVSSMAVASSVKEYSEYFASEIEEIEG